MSKDLGTTLFIVFFVIWVISAHFLFNGPNVNKPLKPPKPKKRKKSKANLKLVKWDAND